MRHATLLLSVALLGALAVGTLLVLNAEGARGPRSAAPARGAATRTEVLVPKAMRPAPPRPGRAGPPIPAVGTDDLASDLVRPGLAPAERMASARELERRMGGRATAALRERLLAMLAAAEPGLRGQIADVLGSLEGDAEAARALVEAWKSAPGDGAAILFALGRMRVGEVAPALLAFVGEGLPDEPLLVRTIGRLARPQDLDQLLARLDRPLAAASRTEIERVLQEAPFLHAKASAALEGAKLQKRRSILRILAASTDPRHAATMRALLGKRIDAESRGIVIRALGDRGDPDSARALIGLMGRGSAEDRLRAARAISSIRDKDTVALLARDWPRLDGEARAAVVGAIARLPAPTDAMFAVAGEEGLYDAEPRVRQSAARVLGKRGRDENVAALARLLHRSAGPAESAAALSALEGIGTRKAALAAIRHLDSVVDGTSRDIWRRRFERIAAGHGA